MTRRWVILVAYTRRQLWHIRTALCRFFLGLARSEPYLIGVGPFEVPAQYLGKSLASTNLFHQDH